MTQPDRDRSEPHVCAKCGHWSAHHGMKRCFHDSGAGNPKCDCDGWAATQPPSPVAESGLLKAWEAVERFIEVRSTTITAEKAWEAWQDALLAAAAPPALNFGDLSAAPPAAPCSTCGARVPLTTCHECHWKAVRRSAAAPPAGGLGPIPMGYTGDLNAEERTGYEFGIRHANEWLAARLASRDQEEGE